MTDAPRAPPPRLPSGMRWASARCHDHKFGRRDSHSPITIGFAAYSPPRHEKRNLALAAPEGKGRAWTVPYRGKLMGKMGGGKNSSIKLSWAAKGRARATGRRKRLEARTTRMGDPCRRRSRQSRGAPTMRRRSTNAPGPSSSKERRTSTERGSACRSRPPLRPPLSPPNWLNWVADNPVSRTPCALGSRARQSVDHAA